LHSWLIPIRVLLTPSTFASHYFYAAFCAHRTTCLKSDGKDFLSVTLVMNCDGSYRIKTWNLLAASASTLEKSQAFSREK
jgi:hypothetical protein